MGILDKYKVATKAPKIRAQRATKDPIASIRKKFVAGVERQKAQAKAWKPGAKDLRSWVTRDEDRGLAWITVKYGARPVAIKGRAQATIGPVELSKAPQVFDDLKKAAEAGELDKGLLKAAIQGPRKKKSA
jgi:hypothetical protein